MPPPKCWRSSCSMSVARRCASYSVRSPGMRRCISIDMLLPMRRVRRLCMPLTPSSDSAMSLILRSTSSGRLFSKSSSDACFISARAVFMMKMLTMTAAMGSSTLQRSPRKMAPPMPNAVPMDEKASLRWCQALATTACDCASRPAFTVKR